MNPSTPIEQRLVEALEECSRLQEENRQLRDRLGMGHEQTPVQPISPAPADGAAAINSKSSPEEKVRLFRSLFRGRDDVYAMRWEGRNNGKPEMHELYAALADNKWRNDLIRVDLLRSIKAGRSPILLTERTSQVDEFASRLTGLVKHIVVLKGERLSGNVAEIKTIMAWLMAL